jgi:hypothetical protein
LLASPSPNGVAAVSGKASKEVIRRAAHQFGSFGGTPPEVLVDLRVYRLMVADPIVKCVKTKTSRRAFPSTRSRQLSYVD